MDPAEAEAVLVESAEETASAAASAASAPAAQPLPPVEECLFGPSRLIPKIVMGVIDNDNDNDIDKHSNPNKSTASVASSQSDDDDNFDEDEDATNTKLAKAAMAAATTTNASTSNTTGMYDSIYLGHWGQAAAQHDIEMPILRRIASHGIVDEGSFRALAWRVLLNYLPPQDIHSTWQMQVMPKRDFYRQLVEQYFQGTMPSGREMRGQESKTVRNRKHKNGNGNGNRNASTRRSSIINRNEDVSVEDQLPPKFKELWKRSGITLDKLTTATSHTSDTTIDLRLNHLVVPRFDDDEESPQEDDNFQDFLEDAMLLEEIRKDVARTMPHLLFFLETADDLGLRRYAALERILFLWAKLNKGVRYVQGMNEIAGTLYYVLANDHNSDWADHAEQDTYFLFHILMMDIRDVFVPDMDLHSTGIQGRIGNMDKLLQTHDPQVYHHLQSCGIHSHFYAYRWLTTLLSREFLLPDTIRLWDSMFASTHKENFLRFVCVTMVMMVRSELLEGDFSANLRLLQRYPPANVDAILESSRALWVYEAKVTLMCKKMGIDWQEALSMVPPPPALIMAYGFPGGVPPKLQHRLETAGVELLGRAQRLWNGWKETKEAEPVAAPESPAAPVAEAPALRSLLFWNRGRRGTNDSDSNVELQKDAGVAMNSSVLSLSPPSDTTIVNDAIPKFDSVSSASTSTRRRIWNDSPKSRTTEASSLDAAISSAQPLPTLKQPSNSALPAAAAAATTSTTTSDTISARATPFLVSEAAKDILTDTSKVCDTAREILTDDDDSDNGKNPTTPPARRFRWNRTASS